MPEQRNAPKWRIFSAQRSVPFTENAGKHNYLVLRGPDGKVYAEIHGTTKSPIGGKLEIKEEKVEYFRNGPRTKPNPFNLGDEDRRNWVEVPPLKGTNALKIWNKLKETAKKYHMKFDYFLLPSGKIPKRIPRLGDTEGQFYETMPTYNSNSAWRAILEENGYDWELYHPREGTFEWSPGDEHRLPQIEDAAPSSQGQLLKKRKPSSPDSGSSGRSRQRSLGPGDKLR
ncbi:MAG: hypothetical protein RIC87_15725 [Kiloniellales bacterium]